MLEYQLLKLNRNTQILMMLDQFRNYYPQGSLISELITIDHGKYIVRALVQINGVVLGTGLAADNIIEIAEDRAINRALKSIVEARSFTKLNSTNLDSRLSNTASISSEKLITPLNTNTERSKQDNKDYLSLDSKALDIVEEDNQEFTSFEEPDDKINELEQDENFSLVSSDNNTSLDSKADNESLDFSEIIARSNIELKRVKWTTEQGRDYLIKTYGKRSRQVLSDKELLDFLHYLENLPTPIQ